MGRPWNPMDIVEFVRGKNILLVGCTGFVGKVMLEKVLRAQPNVGKIYSILRAEDSESVKTRFKQQVLDKELFRTLRAQHGENYENFIYQKVSPVLGDITVENLGLSESVREHLVDKLHIIVNYAANTTFDERYDVAMRANVGGAKNVVLFGKKCPKLQILLHVSTAYVQHGWKDGSISERPLSTGETFGGNIPCLDIDFECDLIERTLQNLNAENLSEQQVSNRMKELGLERAKKFGCANTYTFTKAMGEMMIGDQRGNLPVAILRPTIVESTLADPFPGWIEGNRMLDPMLSRYGRGRMTAFIGHSDIVLDVVPVDTVVKVAMAVMARHAMESCLFVYHVASSAVNPLLTGVFYACGYEYFTRNPLKDKYGNEVKVHKLELIPSMAHFQQHRTLHLGKSLQILAGLGDISSVESFKERYNLLLRSHDFTIYLAKLYEPFLLKQRRFEISNTERLLSMLSEEDRRTFDFDVRSIDWTDYVLNVHIPGLLKHVINHKYGTLDSRL